MRILALDLGSKRTGVALSDELRITARGLTILEHATEQELLGDIARLCQAWQTRELVIGLPYLADGQEGSQAEAHRALGDKLSAAGYHVHYVDESGTSQAAQTKLHGHKAVTKTRRAIDAEAARLILESYLRQLA